MAQAYDLTWHDLHVVQTTTLTTEERERIQAAAQEHVDQVHLTDATMPVGAQQSRPWNLAGTTRMATMATGATTAWSNALSSECGRPPIRLSTRIRSVRLFRPLMKTLPYSLTD